EMEVQLRRAAALRLSEEWDQAADLARGIRERAAEKSDRRTELAASLELGQALLHVPLGEGFTVSPQDADLDAAEEAFRAAADLAELLGDESGLAGAVRELGLIALSKGRAWFVEQALTGQHLAYVARVAAGEPLQTVLMSTPIAPVMGEARELFERALQIYERTGDRRGATSSDLG